MFKFKVPPSPDVAVIVPDVVMLPVLPMLPVEITKLPPVAVPGVFAVAPPPVTVAATPPEQVNENEVSCCCRPTVIETVHPAATVPTHSAYPPPDPAKLQ